MFKCPIGWWLWRGEVVSSWRLFLIIQLFFSPGCDGAWVPPSVPIKAVFLQRNLNWWRQPLRSLEVKSHRTCTADGLCRRRWKEGEKDGNKQALKWQPVSSKELRFSTQFETFHFQIPNFSLKLLSNLQETGETTISCFWRISATIPHENYSHFKYFSKTKEVWEPLDLQLWPALPSEFKQAFLQPFSTQRLRLQRVKTQGTVPNGYKSGFPQWNSCFGEIKLDQYFYRVKGSLWCRWEETGNLLEQMGSKALCRGSEHTNKELKSIHNASLSPGFHHIHT